MVAIERSPRPGISKFRAGVLSIVNHFREVDLDPNQFCPLNYIFREILAFLSVSKSRNPSFNMSRRSRKHIWHRKSPLELVLWPETFLICFGSASKRLRIKLVMRVWQSVFWLKISGRRALLSSRKVIRCSESDWIWKVVIKMLQNELWRRLKSKRSAAALDLKIYYQNVSKWALELEIKKDRILLSTSAFLWFLVHLVTLRTPSELRKVPISYDHCSKAIWNGNK